MPRNARSPNDLQGNAESASPGDVEDAGAPPPFSITPLGADPALGWSGWGSEPIAPWTRARADLPVTDEGEAQDGTRREPRES